MDDPTDGKGSLRFMNKVKSRKKNTPSLNKDITKICEATFLLSITIFLSNFLLTKGWEPIEEDQINIKGSKNIPKELIIDSLELKFPITILGSNPKRLERKIERKFSIQSVVINRKLAPLGFDIKILEREPIAYALRASSNGQEKGLIDKEGYWIPIYKPIATQDFSYPLIIDGWTANKKKWIPFILKNQKKLGLNLKRIIFNPNGNLSLQTKEFIFIDLGNRTDFLQQQLEAISHLAKSLPKELIGESRTTLDLKNPSRPKLYLEN